MMRAWLVAGRVLCLLIALASAGAVSALAGPAAPFDWEKAISLYKQGRYEEAIREFEQVLAESPDHADSLKYIGLAWFQLKEHGRALEPLRRTLELKEREGRVDAELYLALGQSLLSLKRFSEALPPLEKLARLQPGSATNLYLLGVVYANLDRLEESLAVMRRSLQLNPNDTDTIQYIASRQLQAGQVREALALVRQGLSIAPESPELLRLLAESSLRNGAGEGDEKLAAASFNEAIRAAQRLAGIRQDAATLELLGRSYLAARRYPLAEQTLGRAFEMTAQPTAGLCFNLGFALARNRSWNRALERLEQADRLAPDNLNTLYYLGYVNENLRRYQLALEAYTRAWGIGGNSDAELKASIDRVTALLRQP